MKRVIIIGGGLAGISAAVNLSKNFKVILIERARKLGGRASSFFDNQFNSYLDNGQHLLIRGYKHTIDFIEKINSIENFDFQKEFSVVFRDSNRNEWKFTVSNLIKTLNSFLQFKNLSFAEKFLLMKFFFDLRNIEEKEVKQLNALEFLVKHRQSRNLVDNFWRLFIESALNTSVEKASAQVFLSVMKKMFGEGASNSSFVIPRKSLYESLILPSENFLRRNDAEILTSCSVTKINFEGTLVKGIADKDGKLHTADYYVLAVHPFDIKRLIPEFKLSFDYQTIINVHLKFSQRKYAKRFFALWNSAVHWVFFHENHLTIVKSAADEFVEYPNEKIFYMFFDELVKFFPELKNELDSLITQRAVYRVIKEKKAAFISDFKTSENRPPSKTGFKNLFLAGDYIDTGFPSTIESAILSGKIAAQHILEG